MKKTLTILVASSLLFGIACNKKEEAAVTDTVQAVKDAAAVVVADPVQAVKDAVVGDWDKSVVNSLLEFVPADSSMVYASTRAIDLDSPMMKAYLAKSEKMIESLNKNLDTLSVEEQAKMTKLYESIVELTKNYETVAPEWGLDPKGREDAVMYMTDTKVVAKMTVTDGEKTKVKAIEFLKGFEEIKVTELAVGTEKWILIGAIDDNTASLAIHFGAKQLTVSVAFDATGDLSYLNALLAPVANPMSKDALGVISDQTAGIGYIDNVKMLAQALNANNDLGKLVVLGGEDNISEICTGEFAAIVAQFPRIEFNALVNDTDIRMNSVLKVKNADTLGDLKSILGKRIAIATAKSVGSLFVSLDIGKAISVLGKWGNAINVAPYSCEDLSFINEAATSLAGLPQMASGEQFKFVNSIAGLGASLESLEKVDGVTKFSASAYIIGADLLDAAKLGKMMFGKDMPQLAALKVEKDAVSTIDLTELVDMPLMVQTQFNDHGVVMATGEGVDIAAISKLEAVSCQNILSFTLDYNTLGMIEESLKMDYVIEFNMGVSDDGLTFTSVVKL